jgi:hypothetical protein
LRSAQSSGEIGQKERRAPLFLTGVEVRTFPMFERKSPWTATKLIVAIETIVSLARKSVC